MDINADQKFLSQTFTLAKKGLGWTNPNPMVGAIVVKNRKTIAKGYHKKSGLDHAEIAALKSATENPKGATLYVNLEPCSHFGKTPPCVDAIIASGITRVVCCTTDPNPQVRGKGIEKLRQAGIKVDTGLLEKEAKELNEAFFTFHTEKRPFVAIKFASSLDGKIATRTGESKWITNEKAREFARKLRGEYQSILVGINTILKDNPNLGTRIKGKPDPLRIILDSKLRIPLENQVLRDNNVLIVTTEKADREKMEVLEQKGIPVVTLQDDLSFRASPIRQAQGRLRESRNLMSELYKRNIISILVEGGGTKLGSFVDEKLVDKIYAFHAPLIIGGKNAVTAVEGFGAATIADALQLKRISYKKFNDTMLTIGYPKKD